MRLFVYLFILYIGVKADINHLKYPMVILSFLLCSMLVLYAQLDEQNSYLRHLLYAEVLIL